MLVMPARLLLIGLSARMLAQSAMRAGWRPCVVDVFADEDTGAAAVSCLAVPSRAGQFDQAALLATVRRFVPPGVGAALVYGSGLDSQPDLLEELAAGRVLYGNPPSTLRLIQRPQPFFALLDSLAIPYPDSRFDRPEPCEGWLLKSACSEGGKGVRLAHFDSSAGVSSYYQRRLPGDAMSALFLADGRRAKVIGFNTQWTVCQLPDRPFLFAGAMSQAELDQNRRSEVSRYIERLVEAASLRGLNSLDFILDGDLCRVLEINPRPSATMALYDKEFARGLLYHHILACQGDLYGEGERCSASTRQAFKVLYATDHLLIPQALPWPSWSADRPRPGTIIRAGEPLCTVRGSGASSVCLKRQIAVRESAILNALKRCRAVNPAAKSCS